MSVETVLQTWKLVSTLHVTITNIQVRKKLKHGTNTLDALGGHSCNSKPLWAGFYHLPHEKA